MSQETTVNSAKSTPDGRRMGDRRTAQIDHEGPDRRKGDRRSGTDRRRARRLKNGAQEAL